MCLRSSRFPYYYLTTLLPYYLTTLLTYYLTQGSAHTAAPEAARDLFLTAATDGSPNPSPNPSPSLNPNQVTAGVMYMNEEKPRSPEKAPLAFLP